MVEGDVRSCHPSPLGNIRNMASAVPLPGRETAKMDLWCDPLSSMVMGTTVKIDHAVTSRHFAVNESKDTLFLLR